MENAEGSVQELVDELGEMIRSAGATEGSLATMRAQMDQMFADYRNDGMEPPQATAIATVMVLLAAMAADPQAALGDALRVSAGQRPRLPILVLATVLETLK